MRIKEISKENRPRERLLLNGAGVLSEAELLAILLRTGTKGENAVEMSQRLLSTYGISNLASLSIPELDKIKGIGKTKAMQIISVFELVKRCTFYSVVDKRIICAEDVYNYALSRLKHHDKEQFMILYLDSKNRIIKDETISIGTLNSSLIHPREIFKSAIKGSANSIILVHNHPSGDPTPSDEDIKITQMIKEAGDLLNIKVLDHVILGRDSFRGIA